MGNREFRCGARARQIMVLLAATAAVSHAVLASTETARWVGAVSGDWTDAEKWSTDPVFPNDGTPAGTAYDVEIVASGAPYEVKIGQEIAVRSLLLDSADASVLQGTRVTFSAGLLDLRSGLWRIAPPPPGAGWPRESFIRDTVIVSGNSGRIAISPGAALETRNTSIGAPILLESAASASQLYLAYGTVLSGTQIMLQDNALVEVRNMGTLEGTGEIVFDGANGRFSARPVGESFVLGSDITIRTGAGSGTVGSDLRSFVNASSIVAETAGQSITLSGDIWNQGTVRAANGGRIRLNLVAPGQNTGTVELGPDSRLELTGNVSESNLGTLVRTGGIVNVLGDIAPAGSTVSLDAFGGWSIGKVLLPYGSGEGGRIMGGTIERGSSHSELLVAGPIIVAGGSVLNSDVRVETGAMLEAMGGIVEANGRISIDGTGRVGWTNGSSLVGNAEIVLDGDVPAGTVKVVAAGTMGPGVVLRTGSGGGTVYTPQFNFVNQGTLRAEGAGRTLNVDYVSIASSGTAEAVDGGTLALGYWQNDGTLRVAGGTLSLGGAFNPAALNSVQRESGSILIAGTLNNAGNALLLDSLTSWGLSGSGTIVGGSVSTSGDTVLAVMPGANAIFNSVSLDAAITVGSGATATLNGQSSSVSSARPITVNDGRLNIRGTIAGPIHVQGKGATIDLYTAINQGGSALDISAGAWTLHDGASISNALITGNGTLTATRHNVFSAVELGARVRALLNDAAYQNYTLDIQGGLTFAPGGELVIGTGARVRATGAQTFSGPGQIVFDSSSQPGYLSSESGPLTLGKDVAVRTGSGSGILQGITNEGTILASGEGRTLSISGALINTGRLEAADGAQISLPMQSSQLAGGTYVARNAAIRGQQFGIAYNTGRIELHGESSLIEPITYLRGNLGEMLLMDGARYSTFGTLILTNSGVLQVDSLSNLNANNAFAQTAGATLIAILGEGTSSYSSMIRVTNNASLGGHLEIALKEGYMPMHGTSFTLLSAGAISGGFASTTTPQLPGDIRFEVTQDSTSIIVTVVPEPSLVMLAASLPLVLLGRRRRQPERVGGVKFE